MADRYTYVPLIGLFILATWGVADILEKWRVHKIVAAVLAAVVLSCFWVVTWIQVGYWHDDLSLYTHTLQVTNNNERMYNNRGNAYFRLRKFKEAVSDYTKAIEIDPGGKAYYNRALALLRLGDFSRAVSDLDKAIRNDPKSSRAYCGRGYALFKLGEYRRALDDLNEAVRIDPGYDDAYYNRGRTYDHLGDRKRVVEDMIAAARLGVDDAKSYLKEHGVEP